MNKHFLIGVFVVACAFSTVNAVKPEEFQQKKLKLLNRFLRQIPLKWKFLQ